MDRRAQVELAWMASSIALVEVVLHWFPWPKWLGDEMQPPTTYVAGMVPILSGFSVWALRRRMLAGRDAMMGIGAITILAGIAVALCYQADSRLGDRVERVVRGMLWGRANAASSSGNS